MYCVAECQQFTIDFESFISCEHIKAEAAIAPLTLTVPFERPTANILPSGENFVHMTSAPQSLSIDKSFTFTINKMF